MKFLIRIILFYSCISLFSGNLVSLAIKVKNTFAMEIEKEKAEESKEESTNEFKENYTQRNIYFAIAQFNFVPENGYRMDSEKIISQTHQEISNPPPNC